MRVTESYAVMCLHIYSVSGCYTMALKSLTDADIVW